MRDTAGMKFDCIFEEPLDFIDIDYTHLNKTVRYESRPQGEWIDRCQKALAELEQATVWDSHTIKATHILRGDKDV